ncbi:predicted protein [Uncinocarpus reesii 1704]|uniref:Xylanolytic transcriptional activator regulatory domain-containing protein n=1 Tax=Uncinocarpus reesii (strain UAMH 1704) TaxID=336963 RepID=C4JJA3_UNCRE|nr:uncharacterized protein UREG_01710 [Uncinocarpus reesii 1704]EEP76861.1 predicted protein [Uncinocarpus reesii 1704]
MEATPRVPAVSRRRRRPTLACEPCRRKKTRSKTSPRCPRLCDRNIPCEQCSRSRSEVCTYLCDDDHLTGSGRVADRVKQARTNSNRTTGVSRNSPSTLSIAHPEAGFISSRDITAPSFDLPAPRSSFIQDLPHGKSPVKHTDALKSLYSDREFSRGTKACDIAPASPPTTHDESSAVRGIFSKTRFFGQSHWMNSVYHFSEVYDILRKFDADGTSDIRSTYNNCKNLARAIKAREIVNQPLWPNILDQVPSRKIVDMLVHAYLRTFESVFRILHVPSFLRELSNHWVNPSSSTHEFIIKLLLVMAAGISFLPDRNEMAPCRSTPTQWITTAETWLHSPFEKCRINTSGIQIYCLLLLARQTNGIGGDLIWISAGSLLRTAMHMGLHIGPSRLVGMSYYDQEIRRRLWATVLELLLQSSMDAGGLPLVQMQDIDCEPPSNLDDEQLDESNTTMTVPHPKPSEEYTRTSVQIALMKSFPLRLEIARLLNDFRSESTYEKTLQLASRLSSFCRANHLLIQSWRTGVAHPSTFQVKLLDLLMYRFLLSLHHPFAMKAKTDPTLYFSRKISLEVSISLLSRRQLAADSPSLDDDYTRLTVIGTGLFRNVSVQAISTVCDELIHQLEEERTSFMPVSSSFPRHDLRKMVEEYVELLDLRIKNGETNVRGHLLYSCLLAHIDALQTKTSIEQSVANALKKSLNSCYCRLKARADEIGVSPADLGIDPITGGRLDDSTGVEGIQNWIISEAALHDPGMDFDTLISMLPSGAS